MKDMKKSMEYNKVNDEIGLLSLFDSLIPQSIAIKDFDCPKGIKFLIVDTVVRSKFTDQRFMVCPVENGKVMYDKHFYTDPDPKFFNLANDVMRKNREILKDSFLTKREINQF